jgi:hypothetical protein
MKSDLLQSWHLSFHLSECALAFCVGFLSYQRGYWAAFRVPFSEASELSSKYGSGLLGSQELLICVLRRRHIPWRWSLPRR